MSRSASAAQALGSHFAEELGYSQRSSAVYTRVGRYSASWFFFQAGVSRGVGEFTPCVGIAIPSVDSLLALAPGLERGEFPTLGGPLFRFADLSKRKLHEFIIKTSSIEDLPVALEQLRTLWSQVAQPFLAQHATGADWVQAADDFLGGGRLGPFNVPTAGRTGVALIYAARGSDVARDALQRLSVLGPEGKPFQDYEEARRLLSIIDDSPASLDKLREALTQSGGV